MRILHISNDYYNSKVYQTLHQGFLADGMDSVFFVPMKYQAPRQQNTAVIEAHCIRQYDRYFYLNKQRKIYRCFRREVERLRPDLTHGYFLYSGGIHCLWAKREFGIPYVITVQNTDINVIYRKLIYLRKLGREILREAKLIFFASDAYRSYVLDHIVSPEERDQMVHKCKLIPFAVDPFWTEHITREVRSAPAGAVRLLMAGTVIAGKNQLRTANAVRLLREQGVDAELTVVGATIDREMDQILSSLDFVRRIKHIPKEKLIEEYRRADIFVLPSIKESFGLVYAEALTQGLPVLYSKGQGFDRQFPEGFVGYHVDPLSEEDISSRILQTMKEYTTIQPHCGEASLKFTQRAVCDLSKEYYQNAIDK